MKSGKGSTVVGEVVDQLAGCVSFLFRDEEARMQRAGFAGLEAHRRLHGAFEQEVAGCVDRLKNGGNAVPVLLMDTLKTWLVKHIQGEDRTCVPALKGVV